MLKENEKNTVTERVWALGVTQLSTFPFAWLHGPPGVNLIFSLKLCPLGKPRVLSCHWYFTPNHSYGEMFGFQAFSFPSELLFLLVLSSLACSCSASQKIPQQHLSTQERICSQLVSQPGHSLHLHTSHHMLAAAGHLMQNCIKSENHKIPSTVQTTTETAITTVKKAKRENLQYSSFMSTLLFPYLCSPLASHSLEVPCTWFPPCESPAEICILDGHHPPVSN